MHHLFDGPSSLRDPKERLAFWLTILLVLPAAFGLAQILHESIGPAQVALFLVGAMLYITLARGRLIGSSVMIHENQYPRVFSIVKRACATLEIPMPIIFAREDNYTPVAALGFGEPYSLIISSHWIEAFSDDELAFMIGRELGHIAAGHARYLSLLSVNGKENPIIAILFGAWLRRCTFTCDKVGLLVCGTFDAALRAIAVAEFHEFGRKIDTAAFAEQAREIQGDSVLRMGTWLGSEPYATARIASLVSSAGDIRGAACTADPGHHSRQQQRLLRVVASLHLARHRLRRRLRDHVIVRAKPIPDIRRRRRTDGPVSDSYHSSEPGAPNRKARRDTRSRTDNADSRLISVERIRRPTYG